jgi:hypothetical protein
LNRFRLKRLRGRGFRAGRVVQPHIEVERPGGAGRGRLLLRRAAARHQRRDLAAGPRSTATPRSPGPSWSSASRAARPPCRRRSSPAASLATWKRPAGGSSASSATTASSTAASASSARSSVSAPASRTSTPGDRKAAATSKRCTRRSSTSAGGRVRPPPLLTLQRARPRAAALPRLLQLRPRPPPLSHENPHARTWTSKASGRPQPPSIQGCSSVAVGSQGFSHRSSVR